MEKKQYFDVILTSLKESFGGKIWRWLLGSVSASGFVFLVGKTAFGLPLSDSLIYGAYFLGFLFISRFLLRLSTNTSQYLRHKWRESIYGNIIVLLRDLFAEVHGLRKADFKTDEFIKVMIMSCEKIKVIFDAQTKSKCSVSIKVSVTNKIDANASVVNLCRNTEAMTRDTTNYINTNHTVIGNTPYQVIVNSILRQQEQKNKTYYINNNIDASADYQNTSRDANQNKSLPYKSELVVPIIPLTRQIPNNYNLLGFICVDCDTEDKFTDEVYGSAILEGIADGLYDVIEKYMTIKSN